MKKSTQNLLLVLTLLATILWFAGSWWYYSCIIKNTCDGLQITPKQGIQVTDSDNDGLSDSEEEKLGTNPQQADSDHDGIPDNEEVGSNPALPLDTDRDGKINALDTDDDNDGLTTIMETKIGTNPLLSDTDQDGFSDFEEVGRHPKTPVDTDGDGINNALDTDDDDDGILTHEEILLGTNFLLADSDGDGLSDSIEIGESIDKPLDSDHDGIIDALDANDNNSDQDNDGLSDQVEALINTDPANPDTDGDGIGDLEEVGKNINSPQDSDLDGIIDALDTVNDSDSDSDGLSDSLEEKLGSNPANPDTDGDGIEDKEEIGENIDKPLDSDHDGILNINDSDDDNDKLSTLYELQIGTNPILVDSDGDGISDFKEQQILKEKEASKKIGRKVSKEGIASNNNLQNDKNDKNAITIETFGKPSKNSIQAARIYFPFRSANPKLTKNAADYIAKVVSWMKKDPKNIILLTGHTDNIGSKRMNLALGFKRVVAIREFLIQKGANIKQIELVSKGESQPIASNKTKKGRWKNRRVEISPYLNNKNRNTKDR